MRRKILIVLGAAVALVSLMLISGIAFAQDANTDVAHAVVNAVCSNTDTLYKIVAAILGIPVVASLLVNFRNRLPPGAVAFLDALALNFVKAAVAAAQDARKAAPVIALVFLGGLGVAGCQANPATGAPELTPTAQKFVTVLCHVDQYAPVAVQGTAVAATVLVPASAPEAALAVDLDPAAHALAQKACADALPGSTATGITPAAPAAAPAATAPASK